MKQTTSTIHIHGSRPTARMMGETIWLRIPLTDDDNDPTVTVFLNPEVAERLGRELVEKAERAARIAEAAR